MSKALSLDLHNRVLPAVSAGMSHRAAAARFCGHLFVFSGPESEYKQCGVLIERGWVVVVEQ